MVLRLDSLVVCLLLGVISILSFFQQNHKRNLQMMVFSFCLWDPSVEVVQEESLEEAAFPKDVVEESQQARAGRLFFFGGVWLVFFLGERDMAHIGSKAVWLGGFLGKR